MACIITISTGNGNYVEVEVEDSSSLPSSFTELKNLLEKSGKLKDLRENIKNSITNNDFITDLELNTILESDKIIPNSTVSALREKHPTAEFPESDLDNVKILYINKYNTKDGPQFGIYEQNGEQIFVIDDDYRHIDKLANYLRIKQSIEQDNLLQKLDKESLDQLEECRKASKHNSIESMVLEYISNKDSFRSYKTKDKKSVYSLLNSLLIDVGLSARKRNFKNETANNLYQRLKKNSNKNWTIQLQELYDEVLQLDEEINKVIPETFDKFKAFLKEENNTQEFIDLFGDAKNKLEAIVNYITAKEPWLSMSYSNHNKSQVTLIEQFPNIKKVYDVGFDTIARMTHERYNGWYIFSLNGKYYPSEWFLTEATRTIQYNTLEEAQEYINNQILNSKLIDYNFRELYTNGEGRRTINTFIPEGTLISLRDYKIDDYSYIKNNKYRELLNIGTMEDFYKAFPRLKDIIKDPKDAVLFLYTLDKSPNLTQKEIAESIIKSPYKYFYVEQSYKGNNKQYVRVLDAKDPKIEESSKKNYKTPVIGLFHAVSDQFSSKFGINVEVLSQEEVKQKYNISDAKAFINGDTIVLNSTLASSDDIFHEYSHLVLGYLKKQNIDNYRQLLEVVWNDMSIWDKNAIRNKYEGKLPRESMLEEGFVTSFGKHISNNLINNNLSNLFKQQKKYIQDGISSIFDGEVDIKEIFGSRIESVFARFNSEIGYLLNSDNDFLSFVKSNDFFMQRKKSNWLGKQIENKKIEEVC